MRSARLASAATKSLWALVALIVPWAAHAQPAPSAPVSGDYVVYDGGLRNGWQDWGWAHRQLVPGEAAALNMSRYGGWILAQRNLSGTFSSLRFTVRAPQEFGDFLEVRLGAEGSGADDFPKVPVPLSPGADGLTHISLPVATLNPSRLEFDRITFRANKNVGEAPVGIDHVALVRGAPPPKIPLAQRPKKPATLRVMCRAPSHPISPYIYGIAFSPRHAGKEDAPFAVGATIRRWGGNPASRYNPKLGNAWNTASDWFFQNINYTNNERYSWRDFLAENEQHGMVAAMTIPTLGWVAKDTEAHSFSVARMGPQKYSDNDAGNGVGKDNQKLKSPDPRTTSIEAPPGMMGQWVKELEAVKSARGNAVVQYILDNEPALWNSTHRDVHPEALGYDELLARTIAYGEAVRQAAPQADIAGPAEWGWPNYFFSAIDAEQGFRRKPDRLAHNDIPLLAWYLRKLQAHAKKSGRHLLNTLDVHFYPQISGVYGRGEKTSPEGAKKRLRATRSLWDPSYKDESWIADQIELLPRLQRLIDENYPGRRISIGEYNFGGERHISGGLAQAETLGRFAEANVLSAYMWTYPAKKSFSSQAFLAYRDYDGAGSQFLPHYVRTRASEDVSLFASRNEGRDKLVAIAINMQDESVVEARIELEGCGEFSHARAFSFDEQTPQLSAVDKDAAPAFAAPHAVKAALSPYSVTVLELTR